jgi:hypothetical protein
MDSEDFGWTINFPVVNVKCVCDPFAYGALRTYLDTTTSATIAPSVTVPGGPGDVPPWTRLAVKDVAATQRSLLRLGVRRGEATATATSLATAWTAINGALAGPAMATTSTDLDNWQVLAQTPRQTRTGAFRVYGHQCYSSTGTGSLRLAWCTAGGSLRRGLPVDPGYSQDLYLGEVSADSPWDAWVETKGAAYIYALILVPVDSFVEAVGPMTSESMAGATAALDALQTTSTHIGGRTLTTGGTWSTTNAASPTWPVSAANWAERTAVSMASPAFAQAGTGNHMEVQVQATINQPVGQPYGDYNQIGQGVFARLVDSSNYVAFGLANPTGGRLYPRLVMVLAGVVYQIWTGEGVNSAITAAAAQRLSLQITNDGRWFASIEAPGIIQTAGGQHANLASGGTLGNTGAAKAGLLDYHSSGSAATRRYKDFSVKSLAGVTPAPVPSGATLKLAGPTLYNSDLAPYPYIGSGGLTFTPGVNNNLTVIGQRMAGAHGASADTPALDLDIDGYPRFLSVPHT